MSISPPNAAVTRRWAPTAAYDVDPTLGSTTVVGFTELASLYGVYRVVRSHIIFRVANMSLQPVQMILVPLNLDPGSSPSLATVDSWFNNPYGKVKLVPYRGGPTVSMKHSMSTEKLYGTKMVYFDDNFASAVTTIPQNNWYWAIALRSPVAVPAGSDYVIEVDITMDVEFYSRKNLLN